MKAVRYRAISLVLSFMFLMLGGTYSWANKAESLMSRYQTSLVQIRVVNKSSGDKESIGTGFFISKDGLIATNYHVVSSKVQSFDLYDLEYELSSGKKGNAQLLDIDVINDLAIVKVGLKVDQHFSIANQVPNNGEEIYSLGNPHDLGMLVVPGIYNGLVKDSFVARINFTGSINAGMSGGPVINEGGKVVGVNVASAGNQLGFLVPVSKLRNLLKSLELNKVLNQKQLQQKIQIQLMEHQDGLFADILNKPWQKELFQGLLLPAEIRSYLKCWGSSNQKAKAENKHLYDWFQRQCSTGDNFYISPNFIIGDLEIYFTSISSQELGQLRFYKLLSEQFSNYRSPVMASREYVGPFKCSEKIINIKGKEKLVFCARQYKKYPELFDVMFVGAKIDKKQESLISHFTLSAVTMKNAQSFMTRFMKEVEWK